MSTFIVARRPCGCIYAAHIIDYPNRDDLADIGSMVVIALFKGGSVSKIVAERISFPESCDKCRKEPK
jgi:hypothetical protein